MVNIDHLTFSYRKGKAPVLDDITLRLSAGSVYGLLGPNGAGKSTLLYQMAGLLSPQRGKVEIDGVESRRRLPSTLSEVFIVPEEFVLPSIKLSSYVKLNSRYYPRFSESDMKRHLEMFGMESDPSLGQLSMGQKKKVFMAFALACNTKVMLMDEPTNGLDIPGKSVFRRFIASNMSDERLVVISTHQVNDVDNLLDHVIIINEHKLVCEATLNHIADRFLFTTTGDQRVVESALYAQPGLSGTSVVLANDGREDTRVDMEMLFQFAMAKPELINSVLKNNKEI